MNLFHAKKIIFLDQYNQMGGGQTILINLVRFCLDVGYEVELWIPQGTYIQAKLWDVQGQIKYREIVMPSLNNSSKSLKDLLKWLWFSLSFVKYIKYFKQVDKIYINGPRLALVGIITSLFTRKDYYYHLHLVHSRLEKILFKIAEHLTSTKKIVLGSQFIAQNYDYSRLKSRNKKKTEIFSGFLAQEYHDLQFKDRFQAKPQRYNIMLHGRISPEKGQDIFINLAQDFPVHNFYIIGSPSDILFYEKIKRVAPVNVYFDRTQDIPHLVNELNIHFSISPSIWDEPFGLTPIEAMACSCISFVANKGNYINTSKDTNAILFTNYQDLQNKFRQIIKKDDRDLAEIAQKQYQKTMAIYDIRHRAQQFIRILSD